MELAYMQIFRDKRDSLRRISDVSRGALLAAMLDYFFDGIDAEMLSDPVADALWPIYRDMLDQSRRSLEAKMNARRGGRAAEEDPRTSRGCQRATEDSQKAADARQDASEDCQSVSDEDVSVSKDRQSVSGAYQDATEDKQTAITPLSEGNQNPIRAQSEPNQTHITDISGGNQKATRIKNQESRVKRQEPGEKSSSTTDARAGASGTPPDQTDAAPDDNGALRRVQEAREAVFAAAERAGFPMTAADMDRATAYMADYSPEWALEAVRRASGGTREQRCWRYVGGILRRWKAAGGMDAETRPDAQSGAIARTARRVAAQEYTQREYPADALDALFEDLTAEMRQ